MAAIPLLGLTFAMTWMPPQTLEGTALTAWICISLFGFYTAFTLYIIPHSSLGAELTRDHHDRSRIFGTRHASFTLGMMFAFAGMQFVENAEHPRLAAASVAWVATPVSCGSLMNRFGTACNVAFPMHW